MKTISELKERLQRDDQTVYKELIAVHYVQFRRYYEKLVPDPDDFKDVVQVALTHLFEQRHSFADSDHVMGSFYTVVKREAIRIYRASKGIDPPDGLLDIPDLSGDDGEAAKRAAYIERAYLAIDQLSEQQRNVLTLLYKKGKTIKAIAKELNIATSTVRVTKKKALAALRKRLGVKRGQRMDLLIITLLSFAQICLFIFLKKTCHGQ